MLVNDYQRGRLPHFVAPPELKEEEVDNKAADIAVIKGINQVEQNLDAVVADKTAENEDRETNDVIEEHDNGESDDEDTPAIGKGDWGDED